MLFEIILDMKIKRFFQIICNFIISLLIKLIFLSCLSMLFQNCEHFLANNIWQWQVDRKKFQNKKITLILVILLSYILHSFSSLFRMLQYLIEFQRLVIVLKSNKILDSVLTDEQAVLAYHSHESGFTSLGVFFQTMTQDVPSALIQSILSFYHPQKYTPPLPSTKKLSKLLLFLVFISTF